MSDHRTNTLLTVPLAVINVGLDAFAVDLEAAAVPVVHVAWMPPARGNVRLATLLGKLGS